MCQELRSQISPTYRWREKPQQRWSIIDFWSTNKNTHNHLRILPSLLMKKCDLGADQGEMRRDYEIGELNIERRKKKQKRRVPGTTELIKLSTAREDDQSNFGITKNRKLIGLLEQPIPPLWKSNLPVDLVLNPLQLDSPSPHVVCQSSKVPKPQLSTSLASTNIHGKTREGRSISM